VLLALILIPLCLPSAALAIPEGGASPDTPGTYAEVSPKELRPGATIQFSVSGYPAGEVLNIKVDDGAGYSDQTTAGTGVIHTQIIGASGSTSGSLKLPADISEGWHWLRFLASEVVEGKGVLGYTNGAGSASNTSHPTAFYIAGESLGGATANESVVQGTSPGVVNAGQGNTSTTGGSGQTTTDTGTNDNSTGAVDEGTGDASMTDEEAAAAADAALLNSGVGGGAVVDATGGRTVSAGTSPTGSASTSALDGLPLPGLIVLGVVVLLGIVAMMFVALKRPRPAIVSGIDAADRVGDGVSFGGGFTTPAPVLPIVAPDPPVPSDAGAAGTATAGEPIDVVEPGVATSPADGLLPRV
jgi:hypothetical protein